MIDWSRLPERVNADPEFRLASRKWTATLRLDVGAESRALRFEDGVLTSVTPTGRDAAADLFIGAPEAEWRELLAPAPRPFYTDLYGAHMMHGIALPEDAIAYAAYYPALRRLLQVMSSVRKEARA